MSKRATAVVAVAIMAAVWAALLCGCGGNPPAQPVGGKAKAAPGKQGAPAAGQAAVSPAKAATALAADVTGTKPPFAIAFTLDKPGVVTLVIDDADGNRVRNLISETYFEAGKHVVEWDGLNDHQPKRVHQQPIFEFGGEGVGPGRYTVRGLVHDPVQLRYELPFYTAGNPPWDTADGRGGWLQDYTPPTAVAGLPDKMLIGSPAGEAFGVAWTALEGQRLGGLRGLSAGGGWAGAELLARDNGERADASVSAYVANNWDKTFEIEALTQTLPVGAYNGGVRTMSMCLWGAGRKVYRPDDGNLTGLAARDMTVVAAIGNQNKLLVIQDTSAHNFGLRHGNPTVSDDRSGNKVAEVPLEAPRGLAVTPDGRHLLAVSGTRVVRFAFPPQGQPTVVVAQGLEQPAHLAVDTNGNLYVSDQGTHQVKVFTPEGKPLRTIGKPGGPRLGPYDEQRMANPAGLAISADGKLWVAESSEFPRRVSLWTLDGKFVKALYGNCNYGGGGIVDTGDAGRGYVSQGDGTLQLRLDHEKGASAVEAILSLPGRGIKPPGIGYHIQYNRVMGFAVYRNGRRYLSNAYCTASGGGSHIDNSISIWKVGDDGAAAMVSSLGLADRWEVLHKPEFDTRLPQGVTRDGGRYSKLVLYAWADLDGNGAVDPAEVQLAAKPAWGGGGPSAFTLGEDMAITDCLGNRYRPTRFTEGGAPVFDLTVCDNIFAGARATETSGGGQVLDGGNGWAVTTWSPDPLPNGYVAGARDSKLRWRYPAISIGNHAGYASPPPSGPGQIIAISSLVGPAFTPAGTDERLWAVLGLKGQIYVMTTDGLFVSTLFKDYRQGRPGPATAERGALLNDMSLGDDAWATTLVKSGDGKVYVVGGHDSTWVTRVDGLETIRRLPDRSVEIKEENAWLQDYRNGGYRRRITVANVAHLQDSQTDVPVLVKLTADRFDFAKTMADGSDVRFTAADGVTPLAFERRAHDLARKEAVYWVRLNKIWPRGGAFYVYCRPTPNTDLSDAAQMWPTDKYRAVLQMNETAGAMLLDSTPHQRNVGLGARTLGAPGWIGTGTGGDGATGGELTGQFGGAFTISWWIKPAAYDGWLVGGGYYFGIQLRPDGKIGLVNHTSQQIANVAGSATVPLDEWTHVAVRWADRSVFINGKRDLHAGGSPIGLGTPVGIPLGPLNGILDEVRIVEGTLDPQQLMTEYLSETDRLLQYGEPEAGANAD